MYILLIKDADTNRSQLIRHIGDFTFSDDLTDVASKIKFSSDTKFAVGSKVYLVYAGIPDIISSKNLLFLFAGIITDAAYTNNDVYMYTVIDFGFYLKKNSVIIQFDCSFNTALEQLCTTINQKNLLSGANALIKLGDVPHIDVPIGKLFRKEEEAKVSNILNYLLDRAKRHTHQELYYECLDGRLNIRSYSQNNNLIGQMAQGYVILSANTISNPEITHSMLELKNSVILADKSETSGAKDVEASDSSSIEKYGLLQDVKDFDGSSSKGITKDTYASNLLKDSNQIKTTINLDILGDFAARKGVIIPINNDELGLNGNYLITKSTHTIKDDVYHNVNVELVPYANAIQNQVVS